MRSICPSVGKTKTTSSVEQGPCHDFEWGRTKASTFCPHSAAYSVLRYRPGRPAQAPFLLPPEAACCFAAASASALRASSAAARFGLVTRWKASATFVPVSIGSRGSFRNLHSGCNLLQPNLSMVLKQLVWQHGASN